MTINKYKILVLLLFLVCMALESFSLNVIAPKSYKITVRLMNSSDSLLLLAHYYADKQYLDDTAFRDKQGSYVFKGDSLLNEGMYIIAGQSKTRYFDFFLTGTQQMEFDCDPKNVTGTMKVKGSEDNKLFYDYISFLAKKQKEVEPYAEEIKKHRGNADSLKILQAKIEPIDKEVKAYMEQSFNKYPKVLPFEFIKANNDVDISAWTKGNDGKVDSTLIYPLYKLHYFDNLDFSDPRLIYTPVWATKVNTYLDKVCNPNPDSLKKEIDRIIELSSVNPKVQKFSAWFLSLKYETSQILGYDALFVYVVRNYLENDKVPWEYPTIRKNVIDRVNILEPLLLGMKAPNLIMLDTNNVARSLQAVKAKYTLIFFWESTCGHCQHEMPNIIKFYQEMRNKYNLEIFGVSSDTSMVKWKEFIRKNNLPWINVNGHLSLTPDFHNLFDIHSTPVMYLLDEEKKIVAKLLLSDGMKDFITRTEDVKQKQIGKNSVKNP